MPMLCTQLPCTSTQRNIPIRAACFAVLANSRGDSVALCSVSTLHPEVSEEVGMALDLKATPASAIMSDSQRALRNFATGRVSPLTARILKTAPHPPAHCPRLIWTRAHSSLPGNELANEVARDFCCRNGSDPASPPRAGGRVSLVLYQDITQHYRLSRTHFAGPPATCRPAATPLRRRLFSGVGCKHLPALYHHNFPARYCHKCT
ncbi:hypothetical protein HPB48_022801 [Haemaphysalis longicornis]|uniref:Tick transposon n=1 Tax=Haemaphysalis longicornis TaxID=44386 RepID=A0A9J6G974_HAELO|nr:hypothetical protein HPB48_022801 [Haemaphysalis longicornis]